MADKKTRANQKIWLEIKHGRIPPARDLKCQSCGRGSEEVKMEYHHPDYDKPLEVIPLCRPCHLSLKRKPRPEKTLKYSQFSHPEEIKKSWILRKIQSPNGHNIY
jgi:hypothetical protein